MDGATGNIISIKEKQVKITENFTYSAFTSSTKEEEDFRVLLVMDEYTLLASNVLLLSFISKVPHGSCLITPLPD
jgi:hypothetical protein